MLQSERFSKSLLTHAAVDSFSPRITGFDMGQLYDKQLIVPDQTRDISDFSPSPKARRKRRIHSTGSSTFVDMNNASSTYSKVDMGHAYNSQQCLDTNSHNTVIFSPNNKRTQKTSEYSADKLEQISRSTNIMINENELQNLKDLVLRHLDIVKEQHEVIVQKDKVIASLRLEKSTLQTRLDRMDRRLSKALPSTANIHSASRLKSAKCTSKAIENTHERSDLPYMASSTSVETTAPRSCGKRKTNVVKSSRIKKRLAKIKSQETTNDGLLRIEMEYFTQQVHEFQELSEQTIPTREDRHLIEVPSYKLVSYSILHTYDHSEDIDDQSYLKRHQRHENEERRRKRWDLQRLREAKMIEKLKHNQTLHRSQAQKLDTSQVDSFFPRAENAQYLEVCDKLPVNAFGCAVAEVEPSEFSLPWYQPKARLKNNKKRRTTRRR